MQIQRFIGFRFLGFRWDVNGQLIYCGTLVMVQHKPLLRLRNLYISKIYLCHYKLGNFDEMK